VLGQLEREAGRLRAEIPPRPRAGKRPRRAARVPLTFRQFVDRVNPRFQWYRHAEVLAAVLQRVADDELRRVMVFEPPRHGKSELISRLFPAYYLYRHPRRFVAIASYSAGLAYTLSRAARENYKRIGGALEGSARAVKQWETRRGGGLWACGVGGEATGKGFHLGIIDDPIKNAEQAASETIREKHKDWHDSTWYTRAEPDAVEVVVQTRWNEDDLSGWLLGLESGDEPERWHIVNLEAIKEDDAPPFPPSCTLEPDWRKPGEALCPERYPLARLKAIRRRLRDGYFWWALYQQRPRPREGGLFPRSGFPIVDAAPALSRFVALVRYWDKAGAEEGKGDFTVGVLMGLGADGLFYVLDVVRFQEEAAKRNERMRQTMALDRQRWGRVAQWIEQPPGLGKESTKEVIRYCAGYFAKANPVSGDKVERAEPFAAQVQAGNVRLVAAPWNAAFIEEYAGFPNMKHDDQVDGGAGAFSKLVAKSGPVRRLGHLERALRVRK
jgi:predicted phage terminase large subunit-like protein